LPQELRQNIGYRPQTEPQTFATKLLSGVSSQTGWGKMTVMTLGSFQVFMKNVVLTRNLQVEVYVFPKTQISIFSSGPTFGHRRMKSLERLNKYMQDVEDTVHHPSSSRIQIVKYVPNRKIGIIKVQFGMEVMIFMWFLRK
jgi:hypothetical protein